MEHTRSTLKGKISTIHRERKGKKKEKEENHDPPSPWNLFPFINIYYAEREAPAETTQRIRS